MVLNKQITAVICLIALLMTQAFQPANAQQPADSPDPYASETKEQRDARMDWFREARFGMFIHWGVYAVPAGTYNGKRIDGIGEWIMSRGKIPMAEYQAYAKQFNPVKYDPDEWVRLAKEAGMKYIVITSKHHDGFALFDSKVSEWDVVDATPYGKDLLKPLAEACRKYGVRLGFYYSQAQDWNQGGSAARGKWDPKQEHDMDEYIAEIAVPQVREILTNYGPDIPAILWWDTPVDMNRERADQLIPLLRLKPGIIHNNRLGGEYGGDTKTPEQHIPGTGLPGDWESCMTMNGTWGYKSYDDNWKSTETLIRNLVDIASKGGNYLLNVGPTAEGLIPEPSIERLKAIGVWMKVNGESIYGTTASPCNRPQWGRITTKQHGEGTTLFLHVFDWPADGKLFIPLDNQVVSCRLLADDGRVFETQSGAEGITVKLEGEAVDPICSVVALEVAGAPSVTAANQIQQTDDGSIALPASKAIINNVFGSHVVYEGGKDSIESWTNPKASVEWTFRVKSPGTFRVTALVASEHNSALNVSLAGNSLQVEVPESGGYGVFKTIEIGRFEVKEAGTQQILLSPVKQGWKPINLRSVKLELTE
jgi:alpha-L-fucosidase